MMKHSSINWNRAITTNRRALLAVMAEIFELLELVVGPILPPAGQSLVRRLLRPAESALRRLLIIMARDVTVKLPTNRPMPKGLVIKRNGSGRMAFRLYDSRIRTRATTERPEPKGPRIHFFHDRGPLIPLTPVQKPRRTGATLVKRCNALKLALENLPHQARRMALWRLRRAAKTDVKFKSPLRPGQPPGHQKRPRHRVDVVLAACHGLAHEALYANTS